MAEKLKITLVKSTNRRSEAQRRVVVALGLRKLNGTVVLKDTPSIRGMIAKVSHLVKAEEVEDDS